MRVLFILFCIFTNSCSDSEKVVSSGKPANSPKPFPFEQIKELSAADLRLLDKKEFKSKFVKINPGEFRMGSPPGELGRSFDEADHTVVLTYPFYMSKFETTVLEWNTLAVGLKHYHSFRVKPTEKNAIALLYDNLKSNKVLRNKFSLSFSKQFENLTDPESDTSNLGLKELLELVEYWKQYTVNFRKKIALSMNLQIKEFTTILTTLLGHQNQLPVNNVSYTQAVAYCHKLTETSYVQGKLPKNMIYRLPTEAEWEYACRAGTRGVCGLGGGNSLSGLNANLDGGRREYIIGSETTLINRGKLIPVGNQFNRFSPNQWGLYDMHGSVMEWCYDFYSDYKDGVDTNPIGPIRGNRRVIRGGSFYRTAYDCRSANRESLDPTWRGSEIGFRVVLGYPVR